MYAPRLISNLASRVSDHSVNFRYRLCVRGLAGHSHYHNVKHRKAAVDAKRQAHFQKLSHDIHVAITSDGRDPSSNPRLARAIEAAKKAGMPNKRIENALAPPTSNAALAKIPSAVYYGVLPHSVVLRVTALQARPRAIASDLRSLFRRAGGDLEKGGWQFRDSYSVMIRLRGDESESVHGEGVNMVESLTLVAMDCDVTDIVDDGDSNLHLVCTSASHSSSVARSLEKTFPSLAQWITCVHEIQPASFVTVEDETARASFETLMKKLDAHRDVIDVIHNVQL